MTNIAMSTGLCNNFENNNLSNSLIYSQIGIPSIDSLKIRIPTSQIDNFNINSIKRYRIEIDSDGVQISSKQRYKLEGDGILLGLRKANSGHCGNSEELLIMLNSKVNISGYFEGIRASNIGEVYRYVSNYLESNRVGYISSNTFLNGNITDVDIKIDYLDRNNVKLLKFKSKLDRDGDNRTVGSFSAKGRASYKTGLQMGKRETASIGSPFNKIYNKGYEIDSRLLDASNKGDSDIFNSLPTVKYDRQVRNIWRAETTLKNKYMLDCFGLPNSLGELLKVSESKLLEVVEKSFTKWVKKELQPTKELIKRVGLSSEDVAVNGLIRYGMSLKDYMVQLKLSDSISKSTMLRKRKRFIELYQLSKDSKKAKVLKLNNEEYSSAFEVKLGGDLKSFCSGLLYA